MSFVGFISTYSGFLVLSIFVTGWVNRFANAGDTAIEIAENTALRVRFPSLFRDCHNLLKISTFIGLNKQHLQLYNHLN